LASVVEVTFSVTAIVDSEFPPDKHADDIVSIVRRVFAPAEVEALSLRISRDGRAVPAPNSAASK
jgi:hypothetical protein